MSAYRIPDHLIDEVRDSADIVELVSEYLPLKKRGKNYFGLCPFHQEKTPSFSVNPEKQIFHCFGCGIGGNVFSFLMQTEKISFTEAVKILAEKAGINIREIRSLSGDGSVGDPLYEANRVAMDFFHHLLLEDPRAEKAREYLKNREISEDTIRKFYLGYSPPGWDELLKLARRKSIGGDVLEKAGLALRSDKGGFYDRFRDRITFPIFKVMGKVIAFGARALDESSGAKYINSPETPIYQKGKVLYGIWQARNYLGQMGYAIIVEGYMDLLRLVQSGIGNVVATSGTALTVGQAKALSRYVDRAVVVYDADSAGAAAAARGIDSLLEGGLDIGLVSLPEGHDPDSFVGEKGPEVFLSLVKDAEPFIDYKLGFLSAGEGFNSISAKRRAVDSLAETISKIGDDIRRSLAIRELSEKLSIDERMIYGVISGYRKREVRKYGETPEVRAPEDEGPSAERELLRVMLGDSSAVGRIAGEISATDFIYGPYRKVADTIFRIYSEGKDTDPASVIDMCGDPGLAALVSKLTAEGFDLGQRDRIISDSLLAMQVSYVSREIDQLKSKIKKAEKSGNLGAVNEANRKLLDLYRKRQEFLRGSH